MHCTEEKSGKEAGWQTVIDLGSNTFQLLSGRISEGKLEILLQHRAAAGIGKNGMGRKEILPEARQRALHVLAEFAELLKANKLSPASALVLATSAFRNAANAPDVVQEIETATGFRPQIISGDEEAALIFRGVKASGLLDGECHSLLMDIGGGSVEFILCRGTVPLWKKSFELGGLRLMEQFHKTDPMPAEDVSGLEHFLRRGLAELWEKTAGIKNLRLVGCAGCFETIHTMLDKAAGPARHGNSFSGNPLISAEELDALFRRTVPLPEAERKKLPGMHAFRAGMMVVALILIRTVVKETEIRDICSSSFALKEGAFFRHFGNDEG